VQPLKRIVDVKKKLSQNRSRRDERIFNVLKEKELSGSAEGETHWTHGVIIIWDEMEQVDKRD